MIISKYHSFNIPGLCRVIFALADDVAVISDPDAGHEVHLTLKPGCSWHELLFSAADAEFSAVQQSDDSGIWFDIRLQLVNPQLSPSKSVAFEAFHDRDLVFILTDANGRRLLVGTPGQPARMLHKLSNASRANRRQIIVDALSDTEPPFVAATATISGGAFSQAFSQAFRI